ncbi:hypothetical protein AGMMS49938_14030 [Fibrobacterales bacterium]|nr:hypothetical protein AGMMS49938_14030 [Fibrobacterales bacterium]
MRKKILLVVLLFALLITALAIYHREYISAYFFVITTKTQFDANEHKDDFTKTWDFVCTYSRERNENTYAFSCFSELDKIAFEFMRDTRGNPSRRTERTKCNYYEYHNLRQEANNYSAEKMVLGGEVDYYPGKKYSAITTDLGNAYFAMDSILNVLMMNIDCNNVSVAIYPESKSIDLPKTFQKLQKILPKCTQPKEELIDLAKFRTDCNFKSIGKPVQDSDSTQN